jgi:hypothetical protein
MNEWLRKVPKEATLLIPSLVIAVVMQFIFATGYPLNAGRSDNTTYLRSEEVPSIDSRKK